MALKNAEGGKAGGRTTYGNLKDLELLEKKHNQEFEERFNRMEDMLNEVVKEVANNKEEEANDRIQIVNLQKDIANTEEKANNRIRIVDLQKEKSNNRIRIVNLENRVNVLTLASKGYREIRHRFLDVYHCDILGKVGPQGRENIITGNKAAHGGDVITDADLYNCNERCDEKEALVAIYGLTARQISQLGKCLPKFR
jgi:hypothetical protein